MSLRNSELLFLIFSYLSSVRSTGRPDPSQSHHSVNIKKNAAHVGLLAVVCPHYTYCNFSLFGVGWTDYHYH